MPWFPNSFTCETCGERVDDDACPRCNTEIRIGDCVVVKPELRFTSQFRAKRFQGMGTVQNIHTWSDGVTVVSCNFHCSYKAVDNLLISDIERVNTR